MSVYVDDMRAPRRMKDGHIWLFSHMIADTRDEFDEMIEKLGLAPKWVQKSGERQEHYDVTENYRRRAVQLGAIEITIRELATKLIERSLEQYLEGRE